MNIFVVCMDNDCSSNNEQWQLDSEPRNRLTFLYKKQQQQTNSPNNMYNSCINLLQKQDIDCTHNLSLQLQNVHQHTLSESNPNQPNFYGFNASIPKQRIQIEQNLLSNIELNNLSKTILMPFYQLFYHKESNTYYINPIDIHNDNQLDIKINSKNLTISQSKITTVNQSAGLIPAIKIRKSQLFYLNTKYFYIYPVGSKILPYIQILNTRYELSLNPSLNLNLSFTIQSGTQIQYNNQKILKAEDLTDKTTVLVPKNADIQYIIEINKIIFFQKINKNANSDIINDNDPQHDLLTIPIIKLKENTDINGYDKIMEIDQISGKYFYDPNAFNTYEKQGSKLEIVSFNQWKKFEYDLLHKKCYGFIINIEEKALKTYDKATLNLSTLGDQEYFLASNNDLFYYLENTNIHIWININTKPLNIIPVQGELQLSNYNVTVKSLQQTLLIQIDTNTNAITFHDDSSFYLYNQEGLIENEEQSQNIINTFNGAEIIPIIKKKYHVFFTIIIILGLFGTIIALIIKINKKK